MRIRSNYGIIGPVRTVNTSTTGGVYNAEDQRLLKSTSNWARPPATFPVAYNSLITAFSGTKVYVSQANGSDSLSGLTINTPFLTFDKAMTYRRTLTTSNVMIIVDPGTYTVTPATNTNASYIIDDISASYSTVVVCNPGNVIFAWTGSGRDKAIVNLNSTSSAVYGAIFKRNNNGEGIANSYSIALNNSETAQQKNPYYNCVFQETNANGNWSLVYNNGNTVTGTVNYCTYALNEVGTNDFASGSNQVFNNCFFNWSYGTTSSVHNNEIISSTHDLNFTTYQSAQATAGGAGVYYGTYSWSAS